MPSRLVGSQQRMFRRASAAAAALVLAAGIGAAMAPTASAAPVSSATAVHAAAPDAAYLVEPIYNLQSDLCLDIGANSAIQNTCDSSKPTQQWEIVPAATEHYYMLEDTNANCLGISGASTAQGAPAVITSCAATTNREWHIESIVISGTYEEVHFRNRNSNLCLTDDNGSMSPGNLVNQSTCTSDAATIWFESTDAF
jgi:hypothetical protein